MKKIIKLTESDLLKIVKKVINEQDDWWNRPSYGRREWEKSTSMLDRMSGDSSAKKIGKENINPKNLKMGDGGNKNPKQAEDVKILQKRLMDLGLLTIKSGAPTGYFGPATQKALERFYNQPKSGKPQSVTQSKNKSESSPESGFILVFSFPDYQPSVEDNWFNRNIAAPVSGWLANEEVLDEQGSGSGGSSGKKMVKLGKLGHGGCIIITKDGNATLYEFGRYESNDKGTVKKKNLGRVAKISNGQLTNAKQVAEIAKRNTQGDGPRLAMDVVVRNLPNPDAAKRFADVKQRDYTIADPGRGGAMNCGTYALEVAMEGGVDTSFTCFASPRGVVDHLKPGVQTFTV